MLCTLVVLLCPLSCTKSKETESRSARPNVIWVVWDTVRADRLSLYGYGKPTTPRLVEWAKGARVYDNCVSPASSTVPSHASMFTGLLPSEHGANNRHQYLDDEYTTAAELLRGAGYQTYLYSANPHISREENFQQGFDVEEHPWDPQYAEEALRIMRSKILPQDRSSELPERVRNMELRTWDIKATGKLAQQGVEAWLKRRDPGRPFFIFLNYMEAHRPFVPPAEYRRRMMTPEQVARSYEVDRSWVPMWRYVFGLHEYSAEELEVMAGTYDATLAELDELFHSLVGMLEGGGYLQNTVVILTSDHGEHLGEHHLLDHQYSLYNPLIRVPLVIWYPRRVAPGREPRPVMNFDIFPTLLELAGIDPPRGLRSRTVSLLSPVEGRVRLAEYPAAFLTPIESVRETAPTWDPGPWQRQLKALFDGDYKFIWSSDRRYELYNVRNDPGEVHNLLAGEPEVARRMLMTLAEYVASLSTPGGPERPAPAMSEEQKNRLRALGYLDGSEKQEAVPESAPAGR